MKAGRPKLGERAKSATLQIRFTQGQREKLDDLAKDKDLETATWAREILLKEIGESTLTKKKGKVI